MGHKRPLEQSDMWDLPKNERSKHAHRQLQKNWENEKTKTTPSLLKSINKAYGLYFYLAAIPKIFKYEIDTIFFGIQDNNQVLT